MTGELLDCSGDGNSMSVPRDAQSTYIRSLEERLINLEQGLCTLESMNQEPQRQGKQPTKSSTYPIPPTVLEARCVSSLQAYHHTFTEPTIPAIELMLPSVNVEDDVAKADALTKSLKGVGQVKALEYINANANGTESSEFERDFGRSKIRVLSLPLAELLWSIIYGSRIGPDKIALFSSPFRQNYYYHEAVKERLVDMEREQILTSTNGERSNNIILLEELRAYVRLMDETIIPYFSSFERRTASDSFKVSFYELWHLFIPGETIYYSEAKSNPYQPDYDKLRRSRRPDQRLWRVYDRYAGLGQFWVKAYCIDYDGASYICVKEWFSIDLYAGRVSVNSLKVYPIRFLNNAKKVMKDADEVGRGFMETRQPVSVSVVFCTPTSPG
ncbi:hypothetical protein RU639_009432 [Aspergillus parasiticus]